MFYPTHQFFLTAQCVYLLVFRLNDPECAERLQHWLRTVSQFTRDPKRPAKIIIVATHTDAYKLQQERDAVWFRLGPILRASHANVTATVSVSNKTGAGLKELQGALLQAIEMGGFSSQFVPRTYLQVWEWILRYRATRPKLDLSVFRAELSALSEIQVRDACRFLMDVGLCVFDQRLELVVTDLQWLASLFKEVISFYSGVRDGVVTLVGLRHNAWKNLPDAEIRQLMALLERFEMAFPRTQGDAWIVPSMLKEEPAVQQRADKAVRRHERVYQLDLTPSGLVGRVMVRLQAHTGLKMLNMWRHGMLLETADGSQAGGIVLERDELHVQVLVFKVGSHARLIQLITDECSAALKVVFCWCFDLCVLSLFFVPEFGVTDGSLLADHVPAAFRAALPRVCQLSALPEEQYRGGGRGGPHAQGALCTAGGRRGAHLRGERVPTTELRIEVSHPTHLYRVSCIVYRVSCIVYRVSCIVYRVYLSHSSF